MNYPKVCFGCSHPHIRSEEDEVFSEDGKKAYHKNCIGKVSPQGVEVGKIDTEVSEASIEHIEPISHPTGLAQHIIDRIKELTKGSN